MPPVGLRALVAACAAAVAVFAQSAAPTPLAVANLPLGLTINGNINAGDSQFFSVPVAGQSSVLFDLLVSSGEANLGISYQAPSGSSFFPSQSSANAGNDNITLANPQFDTVYVRVLSPTGSGTSAYTFTATGTAPSAPKSSLPVIVGAVVGGGCVVIGVVMAMFFVVNRRHATMVRGLRGSSPRTDNPMTEV